MVIQLPALPRTLHPEQSFQAMVDWIHDEIIIKRGAPGLVVSVSGTDSILAFLACARAYEKAGKPERVAAIHYDERMPDEPVLSQRIAEDPQAFWFQRHVLPWLRQQAPSASILVDDSIEYYRDGARWGALLDWSVKTDMKTGVLRKPGENYWVVGTRNRSEQTLKQFSNVSAAASVQPIIHLWKSEVLALCEHLGVPSVAIQKSCEADCVCGRDQIAAAHIPQIDAMLMVRAGELSPEYLQTTISPSLQRALAGYIDSQLAYASFKDAIPLMSPATACVADTSLDVQLLSAAKAELKRQWPDARLLSAILPQLVGQGHANAACDIVCTQTSERNAWLPEALMLFSTAGLDLNQKQRMAHVFFCNEALSLPACKMLADCNTRLGNYGFSFPKWRFTTQRSGDVPSLVEQFGMSRLTRESDVRDVSLPPSDPNRDELGTGFEWHDDNWYVEYRRGYVVCSQRTGNPTATVVIRNSSYFFGRDRLVAPVYVSFAPLSINDLQTITAESLEKSGRFMRWQDVAHQTDIPIVQVTKSLRGLLDYLDIFDANLSRWLVATQPCAHVSGVGPDHSGEEEKGGKAALEDFLQRRLAVANPSGKSTLYIAEVAAGAAPWKPEHAQPLSVESIAKLDVRNNLCLLSGAQGDFPVVGEPQWQSRVQKQPALRQR